MVEVALNSTLLVAANSSVFHHAIHGFFQAAEPWASSKREHLSQAGGAAKRRLRLRFRGKKSSFSGINIDIESDIVNNYQTMIDAFFV